jgi:hypothetical protein
MSDIANYRPIDVRSDLSSALLRTWLTDSGSREAPLPANGEVERIAGNVGVADPVISAEARVSSLHATSREGTDNDYPFQNRSPKTIQPVAFAKSNCASTATANNIKLLCDDHLGGISLTLILEALPPKSILVRRVRTSPPFARYFPR